MYNKISDLKGEISILNNIAAKLKVMEIEVENILIELEQMSNKKMKLARELDAKARVENLKIYELRVKRPAGKRKTKVYSYWYASWRMQSKVRNVCLGSTKVMTYEEALGKAQKMKAECLGLIMDNSI
jgi:hypothetical protein